MIAILSKIFGGTERDIAALRAVAARVGTHEDAVRRLDAAELRAKTQEFRDRLASGTALDDLLPEAFAVVREAARRTIGQRHYDEQLMGGAVLHQGKIAEMKTGEGKTLTSTLPIYLNALSGKGVHVVTVNDYLARRDANWMGSVYDALGLSTACIMHATSYRYRPEVLDTNEVDIEYANLVPVTRQEAYGADITYGTNNEFGFDYLRDNLVQRAEDRVQRPLHYAIVDEVDSILIDEARTPLIISAPDTESTKLYEQFARLVPTLHAEEHYTVDEKLKAVTLTDAGVDAVEKRLGVGNIYDPDKIHYVHHLEQAIKAHVIFHRDRDYVVKDGQVVIVDDFTGRLMEGRRYSEGLHQAIEAKEGVEVQRESRTLATITFQNYFRLYTKLAGMTGTALTSAEEFAQVYKLDIVPVPTHRPMVRTDRADVIYKTEKAKFDAIADAIAAAHATGQPVLAGTIAIEKSEYLSGLLTTRGIPHNVLNAKHHEQEAAIVAGAGQRGAVTIATNMAGRGTDIKLGEGVDALGGLMIIGSERHEARRIDNQLRGRAGRQGDPGVSQFFVSLEDELMRRFGGDKLKGMMTTLGLPDDEPIANRMISRAIENAQTKIEGFNFDMRKHVLEYDDVVTKQRENIYGRRRALLDTATDIDTEIAGFVHDEAARTVAQHTVGEEFHWDGDAIRATVAALAGDAAGEAAAAAAADESRTREERIAAMTATVTEALEAAVAAKRTLLGEHYAHIVRMMLLQTIDRLWMQHLNDLDYVRSGIGLRGYGQRDPLVEYKRETYHLFRTMLATVRETVLQGILHIAAPTPQTAAVTATTGAAMLSGADFRGAEETASFASLRTAGGSDNGEAPKQRPIVKDKEPGRNDPCPCGSGKKYKKCHGRV